jgi:hypothetical protein
MRAYAEKYLDLLSTGKPIIVILNRILSHESQNQLTFESASLPLDLREAVEFAEAFFNSPTSRSIPHLYISALATWPPSQHSPSLLSAWKEKFPRTPRLEYFDFKNKTNQSKARFKLYGHSDYVHDVTFIGNDKIASISDDDKICFWDINTGECLVQKDAEGVRAISVSGNGTLALGFPKAVIELWDQEGELQNQLANKRICYQMRYVACSPDGNYIASIALGDTVIYTWRADRNEWSLKFELKTGEGLEHPRAARGLCFSPDSKTIICGAADGVQIWDVEEGELKAILVGHHSEGQAPKYRNNGPICVSCSPDGKRIVSGAADSSVWVWDVAEQKEIGKLNGHTEAPLCLAYSPDGNRIATGARDNSVRIWDANTFKLLSELFGHTRSVNAVSFSPDGKTLASCSDDSTIRLWSMENLEQPPWRVYRYWLLDKTEKSNKLMWITPDTLRNVYTPNTKYIFSKDPCAKLDLSEACLGERWTVCNLTAQEEELATDPPRSRTDDEEDREEDEDGSENGSSDSSSD